MTRQQEFVLRTVEERDIRFVRLWFTDVLGMLKSVAISPAELEGAFAEGIGFDGSSIEGFARVYESDMVAKPDPATFQVLPWETADGEHYSARMFCDIHMPDGSPCWSDPRHVLRRTLAKASEAGFTCYVHPEIEFFLLKDLPDDGSEPVPADSGGYFDQASHDAAPHFRRTAIETLEAMGISVEFSHHEGAPGQQEIDLRYADALTMADNVMTFRYVVKEVAITQGVRASFMPKPFSNQPGSGMHTTPVRGQNAFYHPENPFELDIGRAFVAASCTTRDLGDQPVGQLWRLIVGGEAPRGVLGPRQRSALVRSDVSPGQASSRRVEVRPRLRHNPTSRGDPGRRARHQGYELPPATGDVWSLTERERKAAGYASRRTSTKPWPNGSSELVAETLGEDVFDFFTQQAGGDAYRNT